MYVFFSSLLRRHEATELVTALLLAVKHGARCYVVLRLDATLHLSHFGAHDSNLGLAWRPLALGCGVVLLERSAILSSLTVLSLLALAEETGATRFRVARLRYAETFQVSVAAVSTSEARRCCTGS